ncbi:hypothetical protein [Actinomadura sp. 3N508]|uniref:hypothetical protein n=1 Tax=Actinomadura sp. 3N508 TaxID=3375153 RepID=UPI0037962646
MPDTAPNEVDIQVTTIQDVPQEDVQRARDVVARVLAHAPRPVLHAKITLNVLQDPAVPRPNLVSLRVDLNGVPVNAYASGTSMPEAISTAGTRLRARVEHLTRSWDTRRKARRDTAATA